MYVIPTYPALNYFCSLSSELNTYTAFVSPLKKAECIMSWKLVVALVEESDAESDVYVNDA